VLQSVRVPTQLGGLRASPSRRRISRRRSSLVARRSSLVARRSSLVARRSSLVRIIREEVEFQVAKRSVSTPTRVLVSHERWKDHAWRYPAGKFAEQVRSSRAELECR
jgi:hypothetical protein